MTGTLLHTLPILSQLVHTTIPKRYSASEKLGNLPSVTQMLSSRAQIYSPNAKFQCCEHTFPSYVEQRPENMAQWTMFLTSWYISELLKEFSINTSA